MRLSATDVEVITSAASLAAGLVFIAILASLTGTFDERPVLLGIMFFGIPLLGARRHIATGHRRWRSLLVGMAALETLVGGYLFVATPFSLVPAVLTCVAAAAAFAPRPRPATTLP